MILTLTMMNDNEVASKFKAAVRIRLNSSFRTNSKDPVFGRDGTCYVMAPFVRMSMV